MVQILSKLNLLAKTPSLRLNVISICSLRFKSTDQVRTVEICTLKNFYETRPDGLKFNVEYLDTKDYVTNRNAPTILAIHGSPGTHHDFRPFAEKLSKTLGVRFIAPNLPGYEATDNYPIYMHRVEEKAVYLNDFLKQVDVNNVDMLMTHSSGVYPPLYLSNNLRDMPDNRLKEIGSFALFSPPGHRRIKAMRPKWFTESCGGLYCNEYGRRLLRFTGAKIFKLMNVDMKLDNVDNLMFACVSMNNTKEHLLKDHFKLIAEKKVPVFYTFSEDDRLIEKEIFYECLEMLNLDEKDVVMYNRETELSQLGDLSKTTKAISFKKGGHYCLLKHNQIICNYLIDFIHENLFKKVPSEEFSVCDLDETPIKLERKKLKI